MKLSDFDYYLPRELIAQYPVPVRGHSRLLVLHRTSGRLEHKVFVDIVEYLGEKDVLVINETAVFAARLLGYKEATGGKVEVFLVKKKDQRRWIAMVRPSRRVRLGTKILFDNGNVACLIVDHSKGATWTVEFEAHAKLEERLEEIGQMPLPPYISREATEEDRARYQTVYAKVKGAVAAPTAGLHFTRELLAQIERKGTLVAPVLLHVGPGTFRPVKHSDPRQHEMEEEYYYLSEESAETINRVRKSGGRIVAVGTTSVRTLETAADLTSDGTVTFSSGWTKKFIYPPYRFKSVDALVTNFHLPRSTLLMLVSAFAGRELILRAYGEAIEQRYSFYSYGDAMLIL